MRSQRLAVTARVLFTSFCLMMVAVPAFAVEPAPETKQGGAWVGGLASILFLIGIGVASFIAPKRSHHQE